MKLNSGTITRSCRYQMASASSPSTLISGWVTRCSVSTPAGMDLRMKSTRSLRLVK